MKREDIENASLTTTTLNYKSLINFVREYGDLVILGGKGTCKTTLLQHLARELRKNPKNRVILLETFPLHINQFDEIPFMIIKDSDVVEKENYPYLEQDKTYIRWSKDYRLVNKQQVIEALHKHKDIIFLIEIEDMERISAFMTFVIYYFYRKQYQRAKQNCLESVGEHVWILTEESHNLLDSTVIAKKNFNKLRKIHNEFRNLNLHLICVALRLQDLSAKIRAKMSIILSRCSLDDYVLRVRQILRFSKYRKDIITLEKGKFVFPQTDEILEVQPFQQKGKPQKWKPKHPTRPTTDNELWRRPIPRPKPKLSAWQNKLKALLKILFTIPKHTKPTNKTEPKEENDEEETDNVLLASNDEELDETLFM